MGKIIETVVRRCPYTGKLVLAEILIDENDIVCLHNDSVQDDEIEVKNWLNL